MLFRSGFGIYTWSDGRVYQGWWLNRKQCGLGTYIAKGGNSLNIVERKYGLWHVGKRLKWFTKEEVKEIKKGNKDYLTLINDENDCEEILKLLILPLKRKFSLIFTSPRFGTLR